MVTKTNYNQILIDEVKSAVKETELVEVNNPRVIGMLINILEMLERDETVPRDVYSLIKTITLASARVFGRADVDSSLLNELTV
jgi:hypothetical protein